MDKTSSKWLIEKELRDSLSPLYTNVRQLISGLRAMHGWFIPVIRL